MSSEVCSRMLSSGSGTYFTQLWGRGGGGGGGERKGEEGEGSE